MWLTEACVPLTVTLFSSEHLPLNLSCIENGSLKRAPLDPQGHADCQVRFQRSPLDKIRLLTNKTFRFAATKTSSIIRSKLPQASQSTTVSTTTATNASLQPIRVRAQPQHQPLHPLAYLKQSRSQTYLWFSSTPRTFATSTAKSTVRYDRSKFPTSRVSKTISQRGAVPFASTLRPNLTGGALPRSAGGYGVAGKGARYFSHTPSAQAQVIHNVNAGIRAFVLGGGKARFDGVDPVTSEKRFRSISKTADVVYKRWENSTTPRGSSLEFKISPTISALSPYAYSPSSPTNPSDFNLKTLHLNSPDVLDSLTTDFARALEDLAMIRADLHRLSAFGDLPLSLLNTPTGPVLSVRFPGCDADVVVRLCDEVGVRRGLVKEDEGWQNGQKDVEMALLFPFAPNGTPTYASSCEEDGGYYFDTKKSLRKEQVDWRNMLSPSAGTVDSMRDNTSFGSATPNSPVGSPESFSGYESLRGSDCASEDPYLYTTTPQQADSSGCEELESIYRFLQVCEDSRR